LKAFISILLAALVLVGLGLALTQRDRTTAHSDNPEAISLCDEGTRDLNAFRLRAAVEKLGQCLELDPTLAEASIARAMAFERLGERENQKTELARADSLVADIADDHRRMLAQLRISAFGHSRFRSISDSVLTRLEEVEPENIFVLIALATRAGKDKEGDSYENA